MLRNLLVTLMSFLSLISIANAQVRRGSIKGTVFTADNKPAAYVSVKLKGTSRSAISLNNGSFTITRLPPGKYLLEVSLVGYATLKENVIVLEGEITEVALMLTVSEKELEEVIVTGQLKAFGKKESEYVSRMPIRNIENPQSYSVATKELLKEQNIADYSAAVRAIPGIALSAESFQGIGEAFMRGFSTTPTIRNGMAYLNYVGVDPQTLERIEAIKGPSGTLYGSQGVSYGGLINQVTKKPFDHFAGEVSTTIGSFGMGRITADVNTPLDDHKTALLRINAAATTEQSFQDNGFKKSWLFAPSFSYSPNDRFNILIDLEFNSVNRPALTYYPLYASGVRRYENLGLDYFKSYGSNRIEYAPSTTKNVFAQVNYQLSSKWELSANVAYSDFSFNSGTVGLTFGENDTLMRDLYDFYWQYNSFDIQPNLRGEFHIGKVKNNFLAGLDYQYLQTLATGYPVGVFDAFNYKTEYPPIHITQIRSSPEYAASYFEMELKQKGYAAYISDVMHFSNRLHLMLSLRYDKYRDGGFLDRLSPGAVSVGPDGDSFTPKLGLTYEVLKKKVALFTNYMQGMVYVSPDLMGNTFPPERARQTEAGVKIEWPKGIFSSTISYYTINVDDKVRQDPSNPSRSLQDGTQKSKGIDAEIMTNPLPGLRLTAGYQYNDNVYTKAEPELEGKRPYGTPLHSGNAWASYTVPFAPFAGLGAGLGLTYSSDYFATEENTLVIPGYTLFNTNISYQYLRLRAVLSVNNIGNKQYWNFYGMPQQTRNVVGTVALKF